MFTNEMFVETFKLKRDGLRGKKLAKSMADKFSSYSADELKLFAEHVPSPDLRHRARALHSVFLALLVFGAIAAAVSAYGLFSAGDRSLGVVLAGLVLVFRAVSITMVARYRRDGALLVFLGAAAAARRLDVLDVGFAVILVVVAWLWLAKLFPKLTWRGQLRSTQD